MYNDRLDSLARIMAATPSRRTLFGLALAGVLVALGRETPSAKNGKKNGKGKKKGCPKGKRKCGDKCISNGRCCTYVDCTGCHNEDCINGTCQCGPELIMHNGVCGFFVNCKSFGEPCTSNTECCGSCVSDGSGQSRCGKSIYKCIVDGDCESGPCKGFLCPEGLEPYYESCS